MRSIRWPLVPTRIGVPPGPRTARAVDSQSSAWKYAPSKSTVPSRSSGCDDLDRLLEAADAVVEGVAEGVVLRFVPAGAEAEDEAAAADLVDRLGHLGHQARVAEADAD